MIDARVAVAARNLSELNKWEEWAYRICADAGLATVCDKKQRKTIDEQLTASRAVSKALYDALDQIRGCCDAISTDGDDDSKIFLQITKHVAYALARYEEENK